MSNFQGVIINAQLSPDSKYIVTASRNRTIDITARGNVARVWTREGKLISILQGYEGIVTNVQFSPNGNYLVIASRDKTAKVWTREGELVANLQGHQDYVRNVKFSPNGRFIVTASKDKTLKVWKLEIDYLLSQACQQIANYLEYNPQAEKDRDLCKDLEQVDF